MIKILRQPAVELIFKPAIDWTAYYACLKSNYNIDFPCGLDLDDKSMHYAAYYPGDMIPMIAGKGCYKAWATGRKNPQEYLTNIIEMGHGSVLEHVNFGFSLITTRAITHEIVRHRAGFAFSQESQRFCDEKDNAFIMPLSIQGNTQDEVIWELTIENAMKSYIRLTKSLMERYSTDPLFKDLSKTDLRKKVREASRGVLPNDTASFLTMTGNVRGWRHFIEMRSSSHAEAGIRIVADAIYEKLIKECPILFGDYTKEILPDGTFELNTKYRKV